MNLNKAYERSSDAVVVMEKQIDSLTYTYL